MCLWQSNLKASQKTITGAIFVSPVSKSHSQSPSHLVSLECLSGGAVSEVDQGSAVGIERDKRMGWTSLERAKKELFSSTMVSF